MNDELNGSALGRTLGTYARSLRQVHPSVALDARLAASIQEYAGVRHVRPLWRRPLPWAVAVASVAAIATGVALLLVRATPLESASQAHHRSAGAAAPVTPADVPMFASPDAPTETGSARNDFGDRLAIPSSQYSLWPTEAAVFRVKASLGGAADSMPGERQYWVDVRVANDGSMRIVRVLPANPEE